MKTTSKLFLSTLACLAANMSMSQTLPTPSHEEVNLTCTVIPQTGAGQLQAKPVEHTLQLKIVAEGRDITMSSTSKNQRLVFDITSAGSTGEVRRFNRSTMSAWGVEAQHMVAPGLAHVRVSVNRSSGAMGLQRFHTGENGAEFITGICKGVAS